MSTLVWPLSSVYAAMASKTGRLMVVSTQSTLQKADTYVGKSFATPFLLAVVRFFAGVRANMNRQCTPLNEALPAALGHARVRSFIGVDSEMSLEVRLSVEALCASQPTRLMHKLSSVSFISHGPCYKWSIHI